MSIAIHQRALRQVGWILGGILAFGTLLDSLSNAISLITPGLTYIGSILIIALLMCLHLLFERRMIVYVTRHGVSSYPTRVGAALILTCLGGIILLWVPRVLDAHLWSTDAPTLVIHDKPSGLGHPLEYDKTQEYLYAITANVYDDSVTSGYCVVVPLSLCVYNHGNHSFDDLQVTWSLPISANASQMGSKRDEDTDLSCRVYEEAGQIIRVLSTRSIAPGTAVGFSDFIELPIASMPSDGFVCNVHISVSARDFRLRTLNLTVRGFVADDLESAAELFRNRVALQLALQERRKYSAFTYLLQSIANEDVFAIATVPAFHFSRGPAGRIGYICESTALDNCFKIAYDPLPASYAFQ